MGAGAHALANASTCQSGVWSLHNNIAGLAETDRAAAGFSFHAVPESPYFNRMAAAFALPLKHGAAGVSFFRFGDALYNEQIVSVGFGHTFGLASLGLKANYTQYRAGGQETRRVVTLSFGGIATLTPQLSFGAHILNLNQPVINALTGERVPTRLAAGIAFHHADRLFVATEVEKDLEFPPTWRSGLEYRFVGEIAFRTGFQLHPQKGFFGVGFTSKRSDLGYALELDHHVGLSHQATVTYYFGKP